MFGEKDRFYTMKRLFSVLLLVATLLSAFNFAACGNKMTIKDGYYYCSKNEVTYQMTPFVYVPVAIGKEYATFKNGDLEYTFHEIKGASPEKWLSTEDGSLFCAVGEKMPSLVEMDSNGILICYEQTNVVALGTIREANEIDSIINSFENGDTVKFHDGEVDQFYKLRFMSGKYPWLYYSLSYVEYTEDVCEYDEPKDMSAYEYRDVSDEVEVTTETVYTCWYKVNSKDEETAYVGIAEKAEIEYGKLTKPNGDGTVSDYVIFYFYSESSVEECVDTVIENYKNGTLTDAALRTKLSVPAKSESKNRITYNYGKYFIYDSVNGKCVRLDDTVHQYVGDSEE